ncbi:MAG: 4-oxalocrotonate tautomerase family protein [Neptuniibacter sp.]|jgi:4-oxalocrotonate tautomerase
MPIAQIYMIEGRSEEQKAKVIEKVSDALNEATGAPKEAIRIIIQEVPSENWGKAGVTAKSEGR